jgi:DNA-nicking Smr family endonuclease
MSLISENDKRTWKNYIDNFKSFNVSFPNDNKDVVNNTPKKAFQKNVSLSHLKLIKQGKVKPDGVLDLHGYKLYDAKIAIQKYIVNAYEENVRNILIITGKGQNNTGVLKKEVPLWLNDKVLTNLLVNYKVAPKNFGGEGALLVRIKNKNKNSN